jgi:hypothetical protein
MVDQIRQAGADTESETREEIEVTEEMIQAGIGALWEWSGNTDPAIVRAVFMAMALASPSHSLKIEISK